MNDSVRIEHSVELINIVPYNPLISKCQIKVCYVQEEENPNHSIITKKVAKDSIAPSLPGSPIVGYYNETKQDFEGHNRSLTIENGKMKLKDDTRPYGFVDLNAKVWFEKFDDNGVEHEYLMTEGWLWTGQYPEAQRIIEKGNNQSMELDEKIINAYWTKDDNGKRKFFIINEAIISKLCILGEEVAPCFEGAQITGEIKFSLEDDFKTRMFSLMEEMKNILEGGASTMDNAEIIEETTVEEVAIEEPVVEEPAAEETPVVEETPAVEEDPAQETEVPAVEEPVAATYDLNNIVEYQELQTKYSELAENFSTLEATNASLVAELERLRIFKATIDKREKQNMINSFYMLSDEDKKDVIENIDTYSIDDIEAKLSIICVRNKVNFNLEEDNTNNNEEEPITYSLQDCQDDMIPAWVKSLQSVAESMK